MHYNYVSLNKPVPRFASSLAEGASIASARPPRCAPVPRGPAARAKSWAPGSWRLPTGHRAGILSPCCAADVSALPLAAGRLHRPPLPRHARKAPREIQQQVRAARGPPRKLGMGGRPAAAVHRAEGTCRSLLPSRGAPLAPLPTGPAAARRRRRGVRPDLGNGQGMRRAWPRGRGRARRGSRVLLWAPCSTVGCSNLAAHPVTFIHAL